MWLDAFLALHLLRKKLSQNIDSLERREEEVKYKIHAEYK